MTLVVVDASVAAKWIIAEPDTAIANELLHSGFTFAGPEALRIEVAGAVLRRFRAGTMTEPVARAAAEKWHTMIDAEMVRMVPLGEVYDEALSLAFQIKHALTDCLYLATAIRFDAQLLTADATLYERARKAHTHVKLFGKAA
jgi:predicted nucleic acid-binding protein